MKLPMNSLVLLSLLCGAQVQSFVVQPAALNNVALAATPGTDALAPPLAQPMAPPVPAQSVPPPMPPPVPSFAERIDGRMERRYPAYTNSPQRDWRFRAWSPPLLQGGNEDRYGIPPMSMTNNPPEGWKDRAWSPPLLTGGNEDRYGIPPMSMTTSPRTNWRDRAWSAPLSQGGNDALPNRWQNDL